MKKRHLMTYIRVNNVNIDEVKRDPAGGNELIEQALS